MPNEHQEGIDLILMLYEKLKEKDPKNTLLSLIEVDDKSKTFRKKADFDPKYCLDNDYNYLQSYVRYCLDLLKEIDVKWNGCGNQNLRHKRPINMEDEFDD